MLNYNTRVAIISPLSKLAIMVNHGLHTFPGLYALTDVLSLALTSQ